MRRFFVYILFIGSALFVSLSGEVSVPLSLPSTVLGTLDPELFDEASGVAVSQRFGDRLYHINDSGSRGFNFFYTDLRGTLLGETQVNDVKRKRKDVEDLTLGFCDVPGGVSRCLYIGSIGDNRRNREDLDVVLVEEREFEERTDFVKHLKLRFPDGKHDAEAMAVHPNGDLYLLTRSWRVFPIIPAPARLYTFSRERIVAAADAEVQTLSFVGELDLPRLSGETLGSVATSFDIAPDGGKFLVLTYRRALEFYLDLSKAPLKPSREMIAGRDYAALDIPPLPQQEAVSYLPNGRDFLYTSELQPGYKAAEIVKVTR